MATLGRAVQRTNILRDIDEDLASQRVYIARTTIDHFGHPLPGSAPTAAQPNCHRRRALREGSNHSTITTQRVVPLSVALIGEILRRIEREGYGREPGRVTVPAWRGRMLVAAHRLRLH